MTESDFSAAYTASFRGTLHLLLRRNVAEAEDVAQEAWTRAWQCRHQYDGRAKVATWVNSIAWNCAQDRVRRAKSRLPIEYVADVPEWPIRENHDARLDVETLLDVLSPRRRLIMRLFYIEGHTIANVAAILAAPNGSVKVDLFRSRGQIRFVR